MWLLYCPPSRTQPWRQCRSSVKPKHDTCVLRSRQSINDIPAYSTTPASARVIQRTLSKVMAANASMSEYVDSYEEALDVVRQFEETTNSKFLVVKRRVYESGRNNTFICHMNCI